MKDGWLRMIGNILGLSFMVFVVVVSSRRAKDGAREILEAGAWRRRKAQGGTEAARVV